MRSPKSLRPWIADLLPTGGAAAQKAAWQLVRALLLGYPTCLAQLARQAERETAAKMTRQFFARWLERPHWEPDVIYAHLNRLARRLLRRSRRVLLLIDFTYLQHDWAVLQVSVVWQQRALPLYRAVIPRQQGEEKGGEKALVHGVCRWLQEQLPAPLSRYVLVMDRGIPSHGHIRRCQQAGFRFVFRLREEWKLTHPAFTGLLREAASRADLVGGRPRRLRDGLLGRPGKGRDTSSRAHVVLFHGPGHQEPWFLATSEASAARAVAIYRQRMRIEGEFRDLKGPWGLDELAAWQDAARVARFLAWVAVYEWWLAWLWQHHQLQHWRPQFQLRGRLSWLTITREWLRHQIRLAALQTLDCL